VLDPASVALKFGFLAVLYLFLLWVSRSAMKDLRRGMPAQVEEGTAVHAASSAMLGRAAAGEPRLLVESAPGLRADDEYDVSSGATLGRGDFANIRLEDSFASAEHARIVRQGNVMVIEDLGSTNGTYLNEEPLRGPQPLHHGDMIRIGDSRFCYLD
jgi:pSer/pThr/pTyr-binding forkhead associated (FHA) protein